MLEDLHLSHAARESKGEERILWQQAREEFKAEGKQISSRTLCAQPARAGESIKPSP